MPLLIFELTEISVTKMLLTGLGCSLLSLGHFVVVYKYERPSLETKTKAESEEYLKII